MNYTNIKNGVALVAMILTALLFWLSFPITMFCIFAILTLITWSGTIITYFRSKFNND